MPKDPLCNAAFVVLAFVYCSCSVLNFMLMLTAKYNFKIIYVEIVAKCMTIHFKQKKWLFFVFSVILLPPLRC